MPNTPADPNAAVSIDTSALRRQLDVFTDPQQEQQLKQLLLAELRLVWQQAVSGTVLPGMTRAVNDPAYADALDDPAAVQTVGDGVVLDPGSVYPQADTLEQGRPAFDMKPLLLRSAKVRHSVRKDGTSGSTYLDIPFRHGTPSWSGKPRKGPGFASTMPRQIYRLVQKLAEDDPTDFQSPLDPDLKPQTGGMTGPYQHTTNRYSGLRKRPDTRSRPSAPTKSGYFTFRRVSSNSDPNSWWNPGSPPAGVVDAVTQELERRLPVILDAFLDTETTP